MTHILDLTMLAPVPVGHRVSVVPLELRALSLFGGANAWTPIATVLVCDETTRIIYAERSIGLHPETTYENIRFDGDRVRISPTAPVIRGVVAACLVLSDSGSSVYPHTILRIEP